MKYNYEINELRTVTCIEHHQARGTCSVNISHSLLLMNTDGGQLQIGFSQSPAGAEMSQPQVPPLCAQGACISGSQGGHSHPHFPLWHWEPGREHLHLYMHVIHFPTTWVQSKGDSCPKLTALDSKTRTTTLSPGRTEVPKG